MGTNENGLDQHAAEFRSKASALGRNIGELGSISKEMAGDAVVKLQHDATRYYDQGMEKAGVYKKDLEKTISANPLVSLAIAAGVGLVAGAYFSRR